MDKTPSTKPEWLSRLERESWQAELIISGAAIIGTLQLPGLLDKTQHYLLLEFDRGALLLWGFAISYWALVILSLIFVFIYHFIIRALWIGMVGLNSNHPEGVVDNQMNSKDYQAKVRAEYGDIDGYIGKLDQKASGIFGTGFAFASIFMNFGIQLSLAILLITFLQWWGLSEWWAWVIGLTPVILLLVLGISSSVFSQKSQREKAWVKKYHFPLSSLLTRLSYPVNTRYIVTSLLLTTNNSRTKDAKPNYGMILLVMVGLFGVGAAMTMSGTVKREFSSKVYHRLGNDPTGIDNQNYADQEKSDLLYEPMLNSYEVAIEGPLWAWVPLPERELAVLFAGCPEPELDEDLTRREKRLATRLHLASCARDYIEVYLNDSLLTTPPPLRQYRTSVGFSQFGVHLDLTDAMPAPGAHTLRIVTKYPYEEEEEGDWRNTYIPFRVTR